MRMMDPVELRLKARMSGRETVLPVAGMLLFGVGGERSDEVLKNRSSSSLGLFIWQGSGGSGGIAFMFFGLAWVVLPDLVSSIGWSEDCCVLCCCCATSIGGDFGRHGFSAGFDARSKVSLDSLDSNHPQFCRAAER